ncbi:MAG: DoxX family membrane protein [Anaerolineales bacterium]|jgi:thiosulfate dehydrogenase [quinone] large subunit
MNTGTSKEKMRYADVAHIEEPPFARHLFGSVRWSWLWLIVRLAIGYEWIKAGWDKLHNSAWVGSEAGRALSGFLNGALSKTGGAHPDVQGWYAVFLRDIVQPNAHIWSYVVSFGEFLVGLALILGIFVGIAAFFGLFMNMSYLLAGTVSVNPLLLMGAMLLVLAWRTAGWFGLDRWVLPALGTPWSPGYIFHIEHGETRQSRSHGSLSI